MKAAHLMAETEYILILMIIIWMLELIYTSETSEISHQDYVSEDIPAVCVTLATRLIW